MNQLPTILKKARQALDLTQDDVAKKLGISQRAYAFYEDETNGRLPKRKRMEDLGKVLDIPIKTLLKLYSEGVEENPSTEEVPKQNGATVLTGSMTIQDHIAIIEARRLEAVARAEEIKAMYNAVQQEKGVLYDIIKENLTQLMANSNKHLAYLEKILLVDRADHETTMDSLDRIEHQPVGSNAKRAGKREFDASKNLRKKDKRSQGGVSS